MPRVTSATPITRVVAGVAFRGGEANTDNPGALAYFRRRQGYTVHDPPPRRRRKRTQTTAQPESPDDQDGDQ